MANYFFLSALLVTSGVNGLKLNHVAAPYLSTDISVLQDEVSSEKEDVCKQNQVCTNNQAVVQKLKGDEGMAYYGSMFVGGQEQVCVYDTGSFDVVIESGCMADQSGEYSGKDAPPCCSGAKCPHARYNPKLSGINFKESAASFEKITYGSGPVIVQSGFDHVRLSDGKKENPKTKTIAKSEVPVKIIVDHEIDLFKETEMTAIVGVGPGFYDERKDRLVAHMGVKRFMVCFGKTAGKDSFWTWHDRDRSTTKKDKENWLTVPVAGSMFWSVQTSHFELELADGTFHSVGCEPNWLTGRSCGGIVDSGTSLLTVPQYVMDELEKKVTQEHPDLDCSDLSKFPTLRFKLGDKQLSLPPQSYVMASGKLDTQKKNKFLAFKPIPLTKKDLNLVKEAKSKGQSVKVESCILMMSATDKNQPETDHGPMVIFGMALFRKYAVQFDLSGDAMNHAGKNGQGARFMRFAEASEDCSGSKSSSTQFSKSDSSSQLQTVNLDKLRISPLQQRILKIKEHSDSAAHKGEKNAIKIRPEVIRI